MATFDPRPILDLSWTRGALDLEYQRWSFAIPIFGRPSGLTSVGILEGSHSDVYVNSVDEKSTIETTSSECYERTEKITIVRRWGLFPQGGFFIRSTYGDQHLALTVEKKARTDGQGRTEYEVALRPMNFKEYKWSYWTFEDGCLARGRITILPVWS
ncbi:hypothetical protein G6F36_015579 [Rhizopus arrhizus]|nr:hypothetical protein G6F36_015579 [Rhizopus arrhizus]